MLPGLVAAREADLGDGVPPPAKSPLPTAAGRAPFKQRDALVSSSWVEANQTHEEVQAMRGERRRKPEETEAEIPPRRETQSVPTPARFAAKLGAAIPQFPKGTPCVSQAPAHGDQCLLLQKSS